MVENTDRNRHMLRVGSKDDPAAGDRDRGLGNVLGLDPSGWVERETVAERPQDEPSPNTTFAERGKAAKGSKKVGGAQAENKAVTATETKSKRRK